MLDELEKRLSERSARGLARAISESIRDGSIAAGQLLPPIRAVASDLSMSPSTVAAAWSVLARAGLIYTDGRRGTRIVDRVESGPARFRRATQHSAPFAVNLSTGLPDPALLPDMKAALRRLHEAAPLRSYLPEPILHELDDLLHHTWPYPCDVITVADGVMDALDLVAVTFLRFGDLVAVEAFTDPLIIDLFEASGLVVVPIALDHEGMLPSAVAEALRKGTEYFFIQPRAQKPTGVSMSSRRASELAQLFGKSEARVFEIDFAGDVAQAPMNSIGTHLPHRTVHIRGYSTPYGPDLRLASMGGPLETMEMLVERRHLGQGWTSRLLQILLLDLLADPAAAKSLARARQEYGRRIQALKAQLETRGVEGANGDGLYLWVPVANEPAALIALTSQGIGVAPGSAYAVAPTAAAHICITAALCPTDLAPRIGEAIASAAKPARIKRRERVNP